MPTTPQVTVTSQFSEPPSPNQALPSPISIEFKLENYEDVVTPTPASEPAQQKPISPIPPPEVDDAQANSGDEQPHARSSPLRSPPTSMELKSLSSIADLSAQSSLDAQMPPSPSSPNSPPPANTIKDLAKRYKAGQPPPGLADYASSSMTQISEASHSEYSEPSQREPSKDPQAIWHTHAVELRGLLRRAQDVDECRLLLDMFLCRMGVPIPNDELSDTSSSPNKKDESIIEMFLSDGSRSLDYHAPPSSIGPLR